MQYTLMHKTKPVLRMEIDESAGTISAVEAVIANGDYEALYLQSRESELQPRDILLDSEQR